MNKITNDVFKGKKTKTKQKMKKSTNLNLFFGGKYQLFWW